MFFAIFGAILSINVWGVGGSAVRGLSLKNATLYISIMALIMIQLAERRSILTSTPALVPLAIFSIYGMFSLFYAAIFARGIPIDRIECFASLKGKLFDPAFLYIAGTLIFSLNRQAFIALNWLVGVYGLLNILAIISFITGINFLGAEFLSHRGQRFSGFASIANQGAYAIAFMIPLAYFLFVRNRKIILKGFFLGIIVSCMGGILLTGSRGAYLLIPFEILLLSVFTRRFRIFFFALGASVGAAVLFMAVSPEFLMSNVERMLLFKTENLDDMSSGRTMIWRETFQIMENQPLAFVTGVGWGTYRAHIREVLHMVPAAHNYFLKIWIEVGTAGLGIFLSIIVIFYLKFRGMGKEKDAFFLQCATTAFFVLLYNMMLASLESMTTYYAWFIGIITNYLITAKEEVKGNSIDQGIALDRQPGLRGAGAPVDRTAKGLEPTP